MKRLIVSASAASNAEANTYYHASKRALSKTFDVSKCGRELGLHLCKDKDAVEQFRSAKNYPFIYKITLSDSARFMQVLDDPDWGGLSLASQLDPDLYKSLRQVSANDRPGYIRAYLQEQGYSGLAYTNEVESYLGECICLTDMGSVVSIKRIADVKKERSTAFYAEATRLLEEADQKLAEYGLHLKNKSHKFSNHPIYNSADDIARFDILDDNNKDVGALYAYKYRPSHDEYLNDYDREFVELDEQLDGYFTSICKQLSDAWKSLNDYS